MFQVVREETVEVASTEQPESLEPAVVAADTAANTAANTTATDTTTAGLDNTALPEERNTSAAGGTYRYLPL